MKTMLLTKQKTLQQIAIVNNHRPLLNGSEYVNAMLRATRTAYVKGLPDSDREPNHKDGDKEFVERMEDIHELLGLSKDELTQRVDSQSIKSLVYATEDIPFFVKESFLSANLNTGLFFEHMEAMWATQCELVNKHKLH